MCHVCLILSWTRNSRAECGGLTADTLLFENTLCKWARKIKGHFTCTHVTMADKEDEEYLRLHLHDYRKENGYVFGFFEGDLKEFLEEYMSSNSSCFVLSERHSKEDNHKRYSSRGAVSRHSK